MRLPLLPIAVMALASLALAQTTTPSAKNQTGTSAQTNPATYDRGIYLGTLDGSAHYCGKIKSFNFTRGASPQLKSITTCTPINARTEKRAEGEAPQPHPVFRLVQSGETPR